MDTLRDKIADALAGAVSQDDRYLEHADAVLRVLAEHGGVKNLREQISLMVWRSANKRAERAEADLAAAQMALRVARHRLDRVRATVKRMHINDGDCDVVTFWVRQLLDVLDAPARPAGHDEAGQ
jgi:hypothetical protein